MLCIDWVFWEIIYNSKNWRSLERWALHRLHDEKFLRCLADNIKNISKSHYSLEIESIWIDGTPQAHGVAREKEIKCELADLLYIVEECDANKNVINKKALLLQGKNTAKFNKIDSGSSTQKERTLFEKLDRKKPLVLRAGVQNSSKIIGSYTLDQTYSEGLADCAKFLLMPKNKFWSCKATNLFPFHVTWTKNEKTSDMLTGICLSDATFKMVTSSEIGKPVIDPRTCEWSRLVTDLENKYSGITMNGYGGQQRINSSGVLALALDINDRGVATNYLSDSVDNENMPYISIVKVKMINHHKD